MCMSFPMTDTLDIQPMKPRSKEQQLLCARFHTLPDPTPVQEKWMSDTFNNECGFLSSPNAIYGLIITNNGGYTVLRAFLIEDDSIEYKNGNVKPGIKYLECFQIWISDKGKVIIVSRRYTRSLFCSLRWHPEKPVGVVKHNESYNGSYYFEDVFSTAEMFFCPGIEPTAKLARNGFSEELLCEARIIDVDNLAKILLTDPFAEELCKTRQYNLLVNYASHSRSTILRWKHAIRICNRNHYIITSASTWLDYMHLLEHFGKDTHNAHYVCPADLRAAHDRLMEKKRRQDAEEARKRAVAEAARHEAAYREWRGRYFDVAFTEDGISIHCIASVKEMADEGDAMHHCVFTNEYYSKKAHPASIILSARNEQGERLETIEVSERSWKVVQCRAKHNGRTEQHDQIVDLMRRNMFRLQECSHKRKTTHK